MERLIADANKVKEANGEMANLSIDSFADVTEAIHIIQTEMDISGYSAEELNDKIKNMSLTQKEVKKVAENMGISYDEVMNKMKDGTLSVKDANILLGTTTKEASTTIEGSLNSMKASWQNLLVGMADENANVGMLIDNLVDSASSFLENVIPIVEQGLVGISELIEKLLPVIVNRIPTIINEVLPKLLENGISIVNTLVKGITDNLPMIIKTGMEIIVQLITGLAQQLPTLIPQMVMTVITIVNTLLDNIDLLIDAGIQLILGLTDGLIEAIPILIEKAPVIIEKLFGAIIRNAPKIINAGGQLIGKLIVGIIGSVFKLAETAPQLISSLVNGLYALYGEVLNSGKHLVEGIWQGISNGAGWLYQKVIQFASNIVGNIKSALGIHSPSRVMRDAIGKWIPKGIAVGIEANADSVTSAMKDIYSEMKSTYDFENQKLQSNLTSKNNILIQAEDNRQMTLKSIDDNKEVNVNVTTTLDGKVVADRVEKINTRRKLQYGLA